MDLSADRDAAAAVAADAQQLGELLADDPRQLIARIRPLASSAASAGQTTLQLLRHVHAGTLPPLILSSWLPLAVKADVGVLRLVIGDEVSQGARRIGLKLLDTLSRRKTKKRSPEVWAALGGPQGLKHLVETLPLQDVRRLLRIVALNRGFRYRLPADDADALVTHFLPALSRQGGQAARDAEGSQRQQTDSLLYLLHLASDELVTHAFGQCSTAATLSQLRLPSLAVSHATLLQRVVTRQLPINEDALRLFLQPHNENSLLRLVDCKEAYTPVSGGLPPETSDAGTVHPAVPFAIDLFRNSGGLLPIYLAYKIAARVVAVASAAKTPFRFIVPLLDEIVKFCAPDDPRRAAGMTDFLPYVVLTAWGASLSTLAPEPSKMFRQPPIGHPTRPTPDDAELLTPLVERLLTGMGRRVERTSDPVRLLISCPFRMGSPLACLPKDTRLPFTVTFCRLFHGIDLETASTDSARYFTITTETLAYYPPGDGQWLLRQLAALAKDEECIEPPRSSTFASLPSGHDKKNHLRAMLQAMLEGGPYLPVSTLPPTSVTVATYKASAEHGAEPNDRLQWACAALELAVKRQDLSLLAEVTQWSERFLNDVHIGSSLLSKMWSHDYCLALSCVCFRNPERYDSSLDDLRQSIKIANDILNFQIDMVLRIRQSPEKRYGRHRSLGSDLICRTVRLRAGRVRHLHRTTRTSYAELGTLLLQSLIPVTIKYESIGLQDEFADLEWDVAEGALRGLNADNCPPDAMLPFLDNLARQRDEIWAKARLHKTPSLGSLPECWPRGLPVQTLVPNSRQWLAQAFKQPILAPYIHQRATGVLRTPRSFAILPLPSDTSAIGAFVNDVPAVIEAYLCSVNTHDTANEVLQLIGFYEGELGATSHYLQVLKDDICRRRIAYRISHWQLRRLQVQLGLERPYESRVPRFPISTISLGAKGDAAAGGVGDDEALPDATPTELTTFDCCLCPPYLHRFSASEFEKPDLTAMLPAAKHTLWVPASDLPLVPLRTQEASIVIALLVLQRLSFRESDSISHDGITYRAMHARLDDASLTNLSARDKTQMIYDALNALTAAIHIVDPTALRASAEATLQLAAAVASDPSRSADVTRVAFKLASTVAKCDQPQLVIDLLSQALRLLPKESKWHEHITNARVAESLPSRDSRRLAESLMGQVFEVLDKRRTLSSEDDRENTPVVKVLSVKAILRQLLKLTTPAEASDMMATLFQKTGHSDIRKVIIDTLIETIVEYQWTNTRQTEAAFASLVSLAHVASVPSERAQASERAWREAEAGRGDLPRVDKQRPILDRLLVDIKNDLPTNYHAAWVEKAVLPICRQAAHSCRRWFHIYHCRAGVDADRAAAVDPGTWATGAIDRVLRTWFEYLPSSYLTTDHRPWALSYIQCSEMYDVKQAVEQQDKAWSATNAGKAWVEQWQARVERCSFQTLVNLLVSLRETRVKGGITDDDIVSELRERAEQVLLHPYLVSDDDIELTAKPFGEMWSALTSPVSTSSSASREKMNAKVARLDSLVKGIADEVAQRRAAAAQAGASDARLSILPPGYVLDLAASRYLQDDIARPDEAEQAMAHVARLLERCAADGANLRGFEQLASRVKSRVHRNDRSRCAALLGTLQAGEAVTLAQSLRISLACDLLVQAKDAAVEDEGVRAMLRSWVASGVDWVRVRGLQMGNAAVAKFVQGLLREESR